MENLVRLSVSDFIALTNQTLEYAYQSIEIEAEVASFKVNQNKFVFFDLKDEESTVGCFMMVYQLRVPIEDGMKVIVRGTPKLTKWGKFSITVQSVRPSGEGSLKKSYELLKQKLDNEGLFAQERKRTLPLLPSRIAVISSTGAAGYRDFIAILDERWGGIEVMVAHVQVQGEVASDQMIRALRYLNELEVLPEVIVMIRGGGSADDLACFNDEQLVRAVAASRVPVLTGIGHEVDESLVDLVADMRASTPSNAAERLVPDRRDMTERLRQTSGFLHRSLIRSIDELARGNQVKLQDALRHIRQSLDHSQQRLESLQSVMIAYNPQRVLERGYSIVRGEMTAGKIVTIDTATHHITAEVHNVEKR